MLRQIVNSQWFALTDLILVIFSGTVWMINPEPGFRVILIALAPWGLRLLAGRFPFRQTPFDFLIVLFLITAGLGYWAGYDETTAWSKFGFIVLAVLLFYALSAQPQPNLIGVAFLLFGLGVAISLYYFITHDFVAAPRKLEVVNRIGQWIMTVRPHTGWSPIHPNYVAGITAVLVPFGFYPVWVFKKKLGRVPPEIILTVTVGLVVAGSALIMATSRGVLLAIISGVGAWLLWRSLDLFGIRQWGKSRAFFSSALLIYLCAVVIFLYAGPARSAGAVGGVANYGDGSRAELFGRSFHLLADFPMTGGGLGSFPGLFSQYVLNIPFYYLPNSHNLFLDVAIEQGLIGGVSFLLLYLAAFWKLSGSVTSGRADQFFEWIVLFAMVVVMIHGMVDDYLYNGVGAMLSLFLIGLSTREFQAETSGYALNFGVVSGLVIALLLVLFINLNFVRAAWFANLGAVQMAKVELAGFPETGWVGRELVPELEAARSTLQTSLQFDPVNQTAHHRLGLISMLETDFETACRHLEVAHGHSQDHRGIIKSLGYCYVWSGRLEEAQRLLVKIPEATHELEVYIWWWGTQGRDDLSAHASRMVSKMKSAVIQP